MLSVGFGLRTKQWRLAAQGVFSLAVALGLLILGGLTVGFLTNPPVRYAEFNSLGTSLLISCAVGVAAGLATVDDAGRREMIGLAATAQIAIIPAWIGLCLILGFPGSEPAPAKHRILALLLNAVAIVIASFVTYTLLGVKASAVKCFNEASAGSKT
jgi:drug/metabolite transporter (DMT)-like permease